MADEIKREVIVDVKLDEADAEKKVTTLTKRIEELKKQNKELSDANKELAKSGQANTKEYIENAKQIEVNKQKISENTASRKSLITTIVAEDKSIKALSARNRELIKQRNEITTTTAEGRAQIALINREIDENTEIIRKNSSAHEKQRMNIGNYASALDNLRPGLGSTIKGHVEMVGGLSKTALAVTGITAVLGGLFAAYAKSTRGARDLARAQDILSSATELATESFSEWIAKVTGTQGGPGILESIATGFIDRVFIGFGQLAQKAAQAKDLLRELEISQRFAQAFYKEDERQAELQRRIRDDENRSYTERLAAAAKVDKFMKNAGDRQIVVLQAQIQAVKDSTVNFDQNREAQLKVAELEAEIADKREEITGKLTENAMAVNQLTREYAEMQRTVRLERLDAELQAAHELYLREKEKRDELREQEAEIISRFNDRIAKETAKRIKDQTEAEKKAAKEHERIERMKVEATVGGIEIMFKKQASARGVFLAIFQKDAIAETTANTYAAAVAAYKALAGIPVIGPVLGAAAAAAATIYGLSRVANIAGVNFAESVPGFADGGLTGTRIMNHHGKPINRSNGDNRLVTVKTGEVILNERQQAALGGDETFRRIGVPGFADGGFTGASQTAEASRSVEQAIETRNLLAAIDRIKVVLPVQDFEVEQARKNSPIIKAQVL